MSAAALSPSDTALVVIDMQRDFCEPGEDTYLGRLGLLHGLPIHCTRAPIKALQLVLKAFRAQNYTIVHTREGHRPTLADCPELKLWRSRMTGCELGSVGPGAACCSKALVRGQRSHDFVEELRPYDNEDVIDGCGKGKFMGTDLDMVLRQRNIRKLLFAGVTTSCCVATTLREAADLGYQCFVLADGTGDCGAYDHADTLRMASNAPGVEGAVVDSVELLTSLGADAADIATLPLVASLHGIGGVSRGVPIPVSVKEALDDERIARDGLHGLRAKLADEASAFVRQLQLQESSSESPAVRDGFACIAACDGGRIDAWPHDPSTFTPANTALVCVDACELSPLAEHHCADWHQQLERLRSSSSAAGLVVVLVGDRCGAADRTEVPAGSTRTVVVPRVGVGAGAFSSSALEVQLHTLGVRNVLLAGWGAATAINTTMRQASDRGFDCAVVVDCVGALEAADLYGVSASTMRKAIFSAAVHSDAVLAWIQSLA